MKNTVIINYANGGWYPRGQVRLKDTIKQFDTENNIDFLGFTDESQIGSPSHQENPYAFKVYAFEKALSLGYKKIIFCDSSLYAVKSLSPLLELIDTRGYIMEEAGHWVGRWCNDNALSYFNLTREEANKISMFSAGFLGLNFDKKICGEFFAKWKQSMLDGAFKGSWDNHRHDMTCGSIIAQKQLDMEYIRGGTYLSYIGDAYGTPSETSIFHLKPC